MTFNIIDKTSAADDTSLSVMVTLLVSFYGRGFHLLTVVSYQIKYLPLLPDHLWKTPAQFQTPDARLQMYFQRHRAAIINFSSRGVRTRCINFSLVK